MVTGALDMMLSLGTGAASFGVLKGTNKKSLLLEVIFVLESTGRKGINVDRFLPGTPIRVVVNYTGDEVTKDYPIGLFNKQLIPGQIDDLIQNESFVDDMFPEMIETATEIVDQLKLEIIAGGLDFMNQTLDHEIDRLAYLHKRNKGIRQDEVRTAITEKMVLTSLIENAKIRIDSLQLIREGEL
jgi:ATP-dependent helicase HepA